MTALRKTPVAPLTSAAPCTIRAERASDVAEREALLDACFGFSARKTGELSLPGPFGRDRLLGLELREGALDGAWGMIVPTATAARQSKPRLAARLRKLAPHAA